MTEYSYLWTTGGTAGDQVASVTQDMWATVLEIVGACAGRRGVAPAFLSNYAGSVPGANQVTIAAGAALVDGHPCRNTANVTFTIDSAAAGLERIDRIVLRCNWASFTVRLTKLVGSDHSSPTAPSITTSAGTTYDILLYQARVTSGGVVTLTDERQWAMAGGDDTTIEADGLGHLRVKDLGISTAKIADLATTTAKLAADSVDDTKAGNRVPQFYRRQGGSATNWSTTGETTYTPGAVRMQAGVITTGTGSSGSVLVTFPVAFSQVPIIILSAASSYNEVILAAYTISATEFRIAYRSHNGGAITGAHDVHWLAIGPE